MASPKIFQIKEELQVHPKIIIVLPSNPRFGFVLNPSHVRWFLSWTWIILRDCPQYLLKFSPFILLAVCPNMATLNEPSGVLTSPYYPRRYLSNEKCSWKITASKGERIAFLIKDISIRKCGASCTCDYLEIQNGSSSDGISDRRRCGYKDSGIVYHSVKDVLRVTFVSDSGTDPQYRGFKATYIKVKYNATTTGTLLEIGFKRINMCWTPSKFKMKVHLKATRLSIFKQGI